MLLLNIQQILRDPSRVVADNDVPEGLARMTPRLLGITAVGAGVFGAVVGGYRGGWQVLYAGLKMPLMLLIPVVLTLPAVLAIYRASAVDVGWRRLSLAGLVGMARSAVLAAASAPVMWLFYSLNPDYHLSVVAMTAALAMVGLPGIVTLVRALPDGGRLRPVAALACVVLLGLTTAQTGWLLRPFVARPRAEVTLFRAVEGDIFEALSFTGSSATGNYREWEPAQEGLLNRGGK